MCIRDRCSAQLWLCYQIPYGRLQQCSGYFLHPLVRRYGCKPVSYTHLDVYKRQIYTQWCSQLREYVCVWLYLVCLIVYQIACEEDNVRFLFHYFLNTFLHSMVTIEAATVHV